MNINKYELYKEPFIRRANNKFYNTKSIMFDYFISLIPLFLSGIYKLGYLKFINSKNIYDLFKPIIFILLGGLISYSVEVVYFYIKHRKENPFINSFNSFSFIPGVILSMIIPIYTPLWILIIGCVISNFIGKIIFGGFGKNIFNPALVGYIFIISGYYYNINNNINDIISSITPLNQLQNILKNNFKIEEVINSYGGLINLILNKNAISIAESSVVALLIGFIYLCIKKVIDYKIPVIYLLSSFIFCFFISLFININPFVFSFYNIFTGGLLFGAVYMATDPVTSPRSVYGRIIYSLFLGLLTMFLRFISDYPDGTATSILFMNMLTPLIDNFGAKLRVKDFNHKKIFNVLSIVFIYLLLSIYTILKINEQKIVEEPKIKIEIISIKQDFKSLENNEIKFNYELKIEENKINLTCDLNGNILNGLNNINENEILITNFLKENKVNKKSTSKDNHIGYISHVNKNNGLIKFIAVSMGYVDNCIIEIVYENEIINSEVNLSKETQLDGGLEHSNGSINDLIDLGNGERIDVVSNVTYTSVALISARKAVDDYIIFLKGGNNE